MCLIYFCKSNTYSNQWANYFFVFYYTHTYKSTWEENEKFWAICQNAIIGKQLKPVNNEFSQGLSRKILRWNVVIPEKHSKNYEHIFSCLIELEQKVWKLYFSTMRFIKLSRRFNCVYQIFSWIFSVIVCCKNISDQYTHRVKKNLIFIFKLPILFTCSMRLFILLYFNVETTAKKIFNKKNEIRLRFCKITNNQRKKPIKDVNTCGLPINNTYFTQIKRHKLTIFLCTIN